MLKITNPFYVSADSAKVAQFQAQVSAVLSARPGKPEFSIAEIRAALPGNDAALTRRVVVQIAVNLGADVLNPKDADV